MAKAVLVMDMPENCDDCKIPLPECYSHVFNKDIPNFKAGGGKPDWCPLIQCPEKKNIDCCSVKEMFERMGWNACLDALEGKT